MGELLDKVKGKSKQVEGIVTGNKVRQAEGQLDEAKGAAKGIVNKVGGALHKAVDSVKQGAKKI